MSTTRSFSPDARQLIEAHAIGAARLRPEVDVGDLDLAVNHRRAVETAHALDRSTWGGYVDVTELLARAALMVSGSAVVTMTRRPGEPTLGAMAGGLVARALAVKVGYRFVLGPQLLELLSVPERNLAATMAHMREHVEEDLTPKPRVVFLTPLTGVSRGEQERLLAVAEMCSPMLQKMGMRVDVPGQRLATDSTIEWSAETMFASERDHLLSGDLVTIIADKAQSYGAGQSQSWCEANQATIYVVSEFTSRVLGCGYWETRAEPFTTVHQVATDVVRFARQNRARLAEHAAQSARIRRQWCTDVLLEAPASLTEADVTTRVGERRRASIASDGLEAMSMTLREYVDLATADADGAARNVGRMLRNLVREAGPTRRPDTPRRSHGSSVARLITDRSLPARDAEALQRFCAEMEIEAPELAIMFAFQDNLADAQSSALIGARTTRTFDQGWWTKTLRGVRLTRETD